MFTINSLVSSLLLLVLASCQLQATIDEDHHCKWKLGSKIEHSVGEQQNNIIEHKLSIDIYEREINEMNEKLNRNANDLEAFIYKQYFLDILAAEMGIVAYMKNMIITGEQLQRDLCWSDYVLDFKYLISMRNYMLAIDSIKDGKKQGDKNELKGKIDFELEERCKFRNILRSGLDSVFASSA